MDSNEKQKIIVIVGPTASGKTSLAVRIAKEFGGEVVSADSRQVYRGLDIGSGKVTEAEMEGVPHHLLDIADPRETYTASDFARDGRSAIEGIFARGKLPIVAGGTFFYVETLLGKASLPDVEPNLELRAQLESHTAESLFASLERLDPDRAKTIDPHNKRRLIRALEIVAALGSVPATAPAESYDALTIGIDIPKETLHHNIHVRLHERLQSGMIEEVAALHASGVLWERLDEFGLEYRYIARHLQGTLGYDEMAAVLETEIRKFAKRQMTWLKRDLSIRWFAKDDPKIVKAVHDFISSP